MIDLLFQSKGISGADREAFHAIRPDAVARSGLALSPEPPMRKACTLVIPDVDANSPTIKAIQELIAQLPSSGQPAVVVQADDAESRVERFDIGIGPGQVQWRPGDDYQMLNPGFTSAVRLEIIISIHWRKVLLFSVCNVSDPVT